MYPQGTSNNSVQLFLAETSCKCKVVGINKFNAYKFEIINILLLHQTVVFIVHNIMCVQRQYFVMYNIITIYNTFEL